MYSGEPKFEYFQYQQLTKDLCYNKPLSLHVRTAAERSSFELQELVEVRSGKCFLTDSAKITHRIGRKIVQATLANSSFKLYYGHQLDLEGRDGLGEKLQGGPVAVEPPQAQAVAPETPAVKTQTAQKPSQSTVLYSRLYADRKFQNASIQFGLCKRGGQLELDTNLSAFLYERQNEYYLYGKLLYKSRLWSFGAISLFDFSCRNLQTNNLVLELIPHTGHRFFVRGEVDGLRNYSLKYSKIGNYFDYVILDYVGRPTQNLALMAQYKYDCNARRTKTIESIIEKKFARNTVKFGVNQLADITFQMSFPLSLGHGSKLDFGIQVADVLAGRRISYGFRANIEA